MNFIRFTEHNDWEGESWNFYIPLEGNEEAIDRLRDSVKKEGAFEVGSRAYPETVVDLLCEESRSGYLVFENKLSGKLTFTGEESLERLFDRLYKGGIVNLLSD